MGESTHHYTSAMHHTLTNVKDFDAFVHSFKKLQACFDGINSTETVPMKESHFRSVSSSSTAAKTSESSTDLQLFVGNSQNFELVT